MVNLYPSCFAQTRGKRKRWIGMAQLSDSIEQFIKELMDEGSQIEVRRNELAQHFGCAPSQINYCLLYTSRCV